MAEEDLELVGLKEDWDWHPREEPLTSARAPTIHGEGRALVVGGTRGIGAAVASLLESLEWEVTATGRGDFDIGDPATWPPFFRRFPMEYQFELVVFCAGELRPQPWDKKTWEEYARAFAVHALGPVWMLAWGKGTLFPWWTRVVLVSTIGAVNAGAVDLGYGMAKAALEKAAKAIKEHEAWRTTLVQLDLVDTRMLRQLPADTLHGRPVLSPEEAASTILRMAGVAG
uniref:Putative SDR family NAD(P)-dependent oxidoreductase n=1 Tax=viral metagenome TaxID=1070528 RepID=A0A6M3L842_9ZZZZ